MLADFEKSGLTGQAYCKAKAIAYTAFANRRRKMSERGEEAVERSHSKGIAFAPVNVKLQATETAQLFGGERLEIVLTTGVVLRVPAGFSATALADIVTNLEV